jgi:hypothetical protein
MIEKQNLADIDKINNAQLSDFHRMLIRQAPIDVFVYGTINPYKIARQAYHIFKTKRKDILNIPQRLTYNGTDLHKLALIDSPFVMFQTFMQRKMEVVQYIGHE